MENIVGRIRYLCLVKGITVAGLERRMNFGNGTVRRWDNSPPAVDKFYKVSKYFGITMEELLKGDGK